ncbi:MAG TPA: 3-hydroxyacyl-CoA dehydrogenase NAD-binding domain-containing protein, partial [Thermoanaerobaculia bacterium]|nr:3-hydroxyacyl-CoA dehydrogenase NAD-binding domain-containing protein [Thermoanaerobaculia bacterium]
MTDITTIAVLGAGTMGLGIAHVSAVAGYETRLFDTSAQQLQKAQSTIHRNLAKGVELGKLEAGAADSAKGLLSTATDLAAAATGAGLVI